MVRDFHHFKGQQLSRSEKIQRKIVELILKMDDKNSESSKVWEVKHTSGCCQIGRILAEKRELDVEISELICVMHDIYAIVKGKYENHAKKGAKIAEKMLRDSGEFSKEEIKVIVKAIAHHSEKDVYSDNPYVELAKDVDVLDCSLYENSDSYYRIHKTKNQFDHYVKRIKKVRKELGLENKKVFRE